MIYLPFLNDSLARSFWLLDPIVLTNGDLDERMAAMLMQASRHLKNTPWIINFPRKTSRGNLASCMPRGVKLSELVRALTSFSESIARRMFLDDGGSSASRRVCSTSPSLQILTRSTRSCKDSRSISGVCCSASCEDVSIKGLMTGIWTYQFIMSMLGKQVETDTALHPSSSSSALLCIRTRDKGLHEP